MRMGMNRRRLPPHKTAGYGLIALGALIMLLSMPLYIYAAIIGGLIAYVGHTLRSR